MKSISSKNSLQEYAQKNKLDLPIYTSSSIGGMWVAYLNFNLKKYTSEPHLNKVSAEKQVADIALQDLKNNKVYINLKTVNKTIIFIDVENRRNDISYFIDNVKSENINILGFVSDYKDAVKKYDDSRVNIVSVPSSRKDASDIGLSFLLGSFLSSKTYENYIIISGDHFAKVLEECINGKMILTNINYKGFSFSTIEYAIEFLLGNNL